MINELYQLAESMDKAGLQVKSWHSNYTEIPKIAKNKPCVRILILDGEVVELSEVKEELGKNLRKYGNNQGSYPCMNLMPLYRITDETIKKELSKLKPEDIDFAKIKNIRSWCENNNWGENLEKKYKICMNKADELVKILPSFNSIEILAKESEKFIDPLYLHQKLEDTVFKMLEKGIHVDLALKILFYLGQADKNQKDDCGTLSVAFDTPKLINNGFSAISCEFVSKLNAALMNANQLDLDKKKKDLINDAFGVPFIPVSKPMPKVKLAGGFDTALRTMFNEHKCQYRYGRIKDESYPLSPKMRSRLKDALDWLGEERNKKITWIKIDQNEILFAYPSRMPEVNIRWTRLFQRDDDNKEIFVQQAERFIEELRNYRDASLDSRTDKIQLFILKKIDKARVKVIYTRQTNPLELEKCSEAWTYGCSNLPKFLFGQPTVPFPLRTSDILNSFWRQNGEVITDKFKPFPKYFGLELLMEQDFSVTAAMHALAEKVMTLGAFIGDQYAKKESVDKNFLFKIKEMLALIGLMLYREGVGKDIYMGSFPYLYGQFLKISDELHALYCLVMRKGDYPTQLAGSSVYQAASEMPLRTLSVLGQRMNPYVMWAKTYRYANIAEKGKESWRAKWLLSMYEKIANKLYDVWQEETRFNDQEKAQLFIGYLASLPKSENNVEKEESNQTEED